MLTHASVHGFGDGPLWCLTWPSDFQISGSTGLRITELNPRKITPQGTLWDDPFPGWQWLRLQVYLTLIQGPWARPTIFLLNATHPELFEDLTCESYGLSLHIIHDMKLTFHPVWSCRCFKSLIESVDFFKKNFFWLKEYDSYLDRFCVMLDSPCFGKKAPEQSSPVVC